MRRARIRIDLVAAGLSLGLAGCRAVHLAPALTDEEARLLAAHRPVGSCVLTGTGVVVWDTDDFADHGLFSEVRTSDALADGFVPDWYVDLHTDRRPSLHPLYDLWFPTVLTLGLLPTFRIDEPTFEYEFRRSREPESARRRMSFTVPRDEVCGWASYLLALLPSWSGDYEVERKRFGERLAVEVLKSGVLDEPPPGR